MTRLKIENGKLKIPSEQVSGLLAEAKAITAIVVASRKTARSSLNRRGSGDDHTEN